jgi:hypothetical protein
MQRRNFLYNAGLLLPALLVAPSLVKASATTINTPLLIIGDEEQTPAAVGEAFNRQRTAVRQLDHKKISNLTYTQNGFRVTTSDNTTFVTEKIVVHSLHRLNKPQAAVEINLGNKTFSLAYFTETENKVTPECWFVRTAQLKTQAPVFFNRNKHAVLCLLGS